MTDEDEYIKTSTISLEAASNDMVDRVICHSTQKYPFCIVWTPIPFLTWFFPFVGHMGIAMSSGVIRDFAGPYHVSTDNMAFGKPTRYWQLDPSLAVGGVEGWDKAITEASEIYKNRNHNLCFDNCHSHVATALNKMLYENKCHWNMVKLASLMFIFGKHVGPMGFLKTWIPSCVVFSVILFVIFFL